MKLQVEKKARARNDLLETFLYLGERNLDAAERFLAAVEKDCEMLAKMPGAGSPRRFRKPQLQDVRSWPVSGFANYLIFYRRVQDRIEVLRVVHGARDIEALFED